MPNTQSVIVLVTLVLIAQLGQAQEGVISGALEREIRTTAFRANGPDPAEIQSSVMLTFQPASLPESRVAIYFERNSKVEVDVSKATNTFGDAIKPVRNAASINKDEVAKRMNVKQTRLKVDQATALEWLRGLKGAISESVNLPGGQERTVHLDGTLYQLQYRAESSILIETPGSEIGSVSDTDLPLVKWMDAVRLMVDDAVNKSQHER